MLMQAVVMYVWYHQGTKVVTAHSYIATPCLERNWYPCMCMRTFTYMLTYTYVHPYACTYTHRLPLFQRYRAMFALRNIGDKEAVDALCAGFGDKSALFKHEIAYVLGQMGHIENETAAAALKEMLKDKNQHPMTRHEAAEALGSVSETDATTKFLQEFQKDDDLIVSQSCDVALDIQEYWHGDGDDEDLNENDAKTDAEKAE